MKDIKCTNKLAGAPIYCIHKGQVPTRTLHDVVLYNFLPLAIIGFQVTETVNVVNPVVPCEPGPPTTEAQCDQLIECGKCPGCEIMEGKCPDLCADPPKVEESLSDFVDNMVETCDDCESAGPDTCDDCDNEGMPSCCPESPYRAGVFTALADRQWEVMCEWSLAAADCTYQTDFCADDVLRCSHFMVPKGTTCYFGNCPRMKRV